MESTKQVIEINGVKMEIDLREAKVARVDTLKVGTRVKLLRKDYGGDYKVCGGVVVGFDAFERLPTIRIAYIEGGYIDSPLKFFSFNSATKDAELIVDDGADELDFNMATVMGQLDRHIETKRIEHEKAIEGRRLFVKHFGEALGAPVEA